MSLQNYFQHCDHHQILDVVILNHNMQNQQEQMSFEQENGLKPFGHFLALNGPYSRASNFFQHFDHYQVLNIVILDSNMQNRQERTSFEQENVLKPHFGPFLALIGPILGPTNFHLAL